MRYHTRELAYHGLSLILSYEM